MKHIILILLLPIFRTAQRDTTTTLLRTYAVIDTVDIGSYYKVQTSYNIVNGALTVNTDTTSTGVLVDYIDSLIAVVQQDSISFGQSLEIYYTRFKEHNTYFQNAKRYLAKLWAIRP